LRCCHLQHHYWMKIASFQLYLHQPMLATGRECKCQKIKLRDSAIRKLWHTILAVSCFSNPHTLNTGDSNQWAIADLSLAKQVQNIIACQRCNKMLTPASNLWIVCGPAKRLCSGLR
jgi:hypothetical protein